MDGPIIGSGRMEDGGRAGKESILADRERKQWKQQGLETDDKQGKELKKRYMKRTNRRIK